LPKVDALGKGAAKSSTDVNTLGTSAATTAQQTVDLVKQVNDATEALKNAKPGTDAYTKAQTDLTTAQEKLTAANEKTVASNPTMFDQMTEQGQEQNKVQEANKEYVKSTLDIVEAVNKTVPVIKSGTTVLLENRKAVLESQKAMAAMRTDGLDQINNSDTLTFLTYLNNGLRTTPLLADKSTAAEDRLAKKMHVVGFEEQFAQQVAAAHNAVELTLNQTLLEQARSLGMSQNEMKQYTSAQNDSASTVTDLNDQLIDQNLLQTQQQNTLNATTRAYQFYNLGVNEAVATAGEFVTSMIKAEGASSNFRGEVFRLGDEMGVTFRDAIPNGIQITDEQFKSLINTFNDTGKFAEELSNVLDTAFSASRSALQKLVDAAVEGGKDWKKAWKDIKDTLPKNWRDNAEKMFKAQGRMGEILDDIIPKLEIYRQNWDKASKKEHATAIKDMSDKLEKLETNLSDISDVDIKETIFDPLIKLKENGLTQAELNVWEGFFNLYDKLQKEGGGISDEDVTQLQAYVANAPQMLTLGENTNTTAEAMKVLTPEQQKIADNKKVKSTIDEQTGAFELQQTYIEGVTGALNLQGQAVRGLTKDFNQLVLIMQKMAAIKPQGGGGGSGVIPVTGQIDPLTGKYINPPKPKGGPGGTDEQGLPVESFANVKTTTKKKATPIRVSNTLALAAVGAVAKNIAALATINPNIHVKTQLALSAVGAVAIGIANLAKINPQIHIKNSLALSAVGKVAQSIADLAKVNPQIHIKNSLALSAVGKVPQAIAKLANVNPQIHIKNSLALSAVGKVAQRINDLSKLNPTVNVGISGPGAKYVGHAKGYHGMVDEPTLMMVGEKGPERVDVTPQKDIGTRTGGAASGQIIVNLTNIISDKEIIRTYRRELGKEMYRFGPT